MYLKNSQARRDLPMPAMPTTETRCAFLSSSEAWKSSLARRSSLSLPTNGGSRPSDLSAPARPAVTDPQCAVERHRLGLAFERVLVGLLVGDRRLRRTLRRLTDEHRARLRHGLNPAGR